MLESAVVNSTYHNSPNKFKYLQNQKYLDGNDTYLRSYPLTDFEETLRKTRNEIIYEGETFSIIPDELFCSGKLVSHSEIRLWLILRKYSKDKNSFGTEPSFLSQEKMAKFMGESRFSTIRHLKNMKEKGLIRVKRLGLTRTNRIYLIDPFKWLENQGSQA